MLAVTQTALLMPRLELLMFGVRGLQINEPMLPTPQTRTEHLWTHAAVVALPKQYLRLIREALAALQTLWPKEHAMDLRQGYPHGWGLDICFEVVVVVVERLVLVVVVVVIIVC